MWLACLCPSLPYPRDVRLVLADGLLTSHRLLLAGVSPLLRRLLEEQVEDDEPPCLLLPDVSCHLMSLLLSLLCTGRAQLLQPEVPLLVALTHQLKLASIPVAVVAEPWLQQDLQEQPPPWPRASITFQPPAGPTRGRPVKPSSSSGEAAREEEASKEVRPRRNIFLDFKQCTIGCPFLTNLACINKPNQSKLWTWV